MSDSLSQPIQGIPPRVLFPHVVRPAVIRSRTCNAMRQWCEDRYGPRAIWGDHQGQWTVFTSYRETYVEYEFAFREPQAAFEFKLRWV